MRLIKAILAVSLAGAMFGNIGAEQTGPDNLAAYYGFDEIEIIKLDWGIKCLRIADFNGDGRGDLAVANNRKARIELLVQKETVGPGETEVAVDPNDIDINAITPPSRFDKQNVAVSQQLYSLVCGDLNSDGMMDFAFYGDPKGLYVILQKSGETRATGRGPRTTKALNWRTRKKIKIDDGLVTPNVLVCADLNNDGADDLALAGRNAIYIVLQKEDGSLSEPVKYPGSARTRGLEVSDLNGDNINDLIIITNNREKPVRVRFGLKKGQLGPEVQFFIEKPLALELHNTNGTIGNEILTLDAISKRLICYKFASEKQKDSDWPILFYPLASGQESSKRDLAVDDLDGDGLADVTISDPGAAEIIFYKQTPGLGLAEPVRFPAFAYIKNLSAADIDGKGKADLVVLSVKEKIIGISKYEGDRLSFPQPIDLIGEPVAMELGDLDSNGSIDCIYISKDANDLRSMRVIYNLGDARKQQAKAKRKRKKKQPKTPNRVSQVGPALELEALAANPDGLKVLDVDQDGLQDVLLFVRYELPTLVRQRKKKEFEIVDSPKAQASLIKDAGPGSVSAANVDELAGDELLIAQKNFARSLVFADSVSWSVVDQYNAKSAENNISAVAAFDIDGTGPDGRGDILLLDGQKGQLQILKAGVDKTYRFAKELNVSKWNAAEHLKMLFAPLTGTAAKSILLFDSEKFALITPPSGGVFPQYLEQQFSYETKIKDGAYGNLTAGDINSDGRCDIIMAEYKRNHIEILTLDTDGNPTPAMRFKIFEQKSYRGGKKRGKVSIEPRELKIADVTGDGKNDLVTVIHDRIIIYPQD